MTTGFQVTFDAADPDKLADFWAAALGYVKQLPPEGHDSWESFLASVGVPEERWDSASAVVDPEGRLPRLFFQRVPEPKVAKNRVHLDVNCGANAPAGERRDVVDAEAARLVSLGASTARTLDDGREYCIVMNDPEGNEFCVQ
jgi:hypothetical protein